MKIVFSEHTKQQNKFRKIPIKYVRSTILDPEEKLSSYRNRQLLRKKFTNKTLEVVTFSEGSIITIITFYWLERNEK